MSQVDQVRSTADIVKVVGDYVKLRKAGSNYMGLCPFHQEKTPSFAVHPTKQIFHCFGCGVGGDVFKFVMMIENLSFPEALGRVAEKVGITLRAPGGGETSDARTRERTALYKLHESAAKFYAAQLGATAEGRAARAYLADRGVSDETIGRFRLGYAPAHGQALTAYLSDAGFEEEVAERSGLVLSASGGEGKRRFDRFRRRVIFSISNESGKVVAFGGRTLGDPSADAPKYLNSPETPIYTKGRVLYHLDRAGNAIRKLDYAILVEGYMDCIRVASAGIENVVATCGTSLTEGQIRLLARYSRRVIVNYDPDSAGVAATERSLDLLLEEGFEAKILALPGGLDPDSFIREQGAAAYRERLGCAPTYLDYLTERAAAQHDLGRPEGKVAAANAVLPYLARVPNALLRGELAQRLAERLRLDSRLLQEELKRSARVRSRPGSPDEDSGLGLEAVKVKATDAEKELLRAFLDDRSIADEYLPKLVESGVCEGLATEGILRRLRQLHLAGDKLEFGQIEEGLSTEQRELLYAAVFSRLQRLDRKQVEGSYRALRLKSLQRENEKLRKALEEAISKQDFQRATELQGTKAELERELHPPRSA